MNQRKNNNNRIAIKVHRIKKNFGNITAINDISFELKSGEIFGLLGPNGAGKSTTLAVITGLVNPDKGKVEIFCYDVKKNYIKASENLGVLVEVPGFYNYLSGYDNLRLFSRVKYVTKKEIHSVLEKLGLITWSDVKVKNYSHGMKKRLGIACALLGNPRALILDEPTSGLDPSGTKMILDLICSLSKNEKISVLMSSNLLHDIESICDRALLISKGKKIFCEEVSELIKPIENSFIIQVEPLNKALSYLKQIESVKKTEKINSNTLKLVLSNSSSAELNKHLVEKGFNIFSIYAAKRTLKDLFLEYES